MNEFYEKYGPWALVTGASSGIGEEFCKQLAALGFNLVIVARRMDRLTRTANELMATHAITVKVVPVDLSLPDFMQEIEDGTASLDVGLLVNCAGFALTGDFLGHDIEEELSLLHVNCRAPLMLNHHFGRKMIQQKKGGIINVSSAAAFMPIPSWTLYSASKIYTLYLSEGLWFELKRSHVDVLALCPGSTRTEFSKVAGTSMEGMQVTPVVALALKNLGKKVSVIPGIGNNIASSISRFISRRWAIILGSMVIGQ